jgi:hypothetical protein
MTASCSILLAVGQAIFQASLTKNLLRIVSQQETNMLIAAGAADVSAAVRPADRHAVVDAYNSALTDVFVSPDQPAKKSCVESDALNSFFPPWGPPSPSYWSVALSGRTSRPKLSRPMRKGRRKCRRRKPRSRMSKAPSRVVCRK